MSEKSKRFFFTPEEDQKLMELVEEYGLDQWNLIATILGNDRKPRQCLNRYKNYLSPTINRGEWTEEEEHILAEKFDQMGPAWKSIAKILNRSDVNVRNHFHKRSFRMLLSDNWSHFDPPKVYKKTKEPVKRTKKKSKNEDINCLLAIPKKHKKNYAKPNEQSCPIKLEEKKIKEINEVKEEKLSMVVEKPGEENRYYRPTENELLRLVFADLVI